MIREATRKSKDGRIDINDFLDHSAASTRYGLFSPMEAQIIFHFAGRGNARQRLSLLDFAQLLDPGWQAPTEVTSVEKVSSAKAFASQLLQSAYNFGLGGIAGAFGATMVYPIDLGACIRVVAASFALTALFVRAVKVSDTSGIPVVSNRGAIALRAVDEVRTQAGRVGADTHVIA